VIVSIKSSFPNAVAQNKSAEETELRALKAGGAVGQLVVRPLTGVVTEGIGRSSGAESTRLGTNVPRRAEYRKALLCMFGTGRK